MSEDVRKGLGTMKRLTLALAFALVTLCGSAKTVSAQEILLEGPLAGAPAVRKLVKYREMRFTAGPQFGYTLLNDYMNNFMFGLRLEFNILDWLSIGGLGYIVANAPTKLTKHITNSRDISNQATIPSESNFPSYTGGANFEEQVAHLKGMYLGQISLIPLRGKLAVFEKLFVAIDGYLFLGGGAIVYQERKSCKGSACGEWDKPKSWKPERENVVTGTFTAGIGFMVYFNEWLALNFEYRLTPFKWNVGGFDESGQAGTEWELADDGNGGVKWDDVANGTGDYPDGNIDENDRSWTSNQSIGIGVIFHFPFEPKVTQ